MCSVQNLKVILFFAELQVDDTVSIVAHHAELTLLHVPRPEGVIQDARGRDSPHLVAVD